MIKMEIINEKNLYKNSIGEFPLKKHTSTNSVKAIIETRMTIIFEIEFISFIF